MSAYEVKIDILFNRASWFCIHWATNRRENLYHLLGILRLFNLFSLVYALWDCQLFCLFINIFYFCIFMFLCRWMQQMMGHMYFSVDQRDTWTLLGLWSGKIKGNDRSQWSHGTGCRPIHWSVLRWTQLVTDYGLAQGSFQEDIIRHPPGTTKVPLGCQTSIGQAGTG